MGVRRRDEGDFEVFGHQDEKANDQEKGVGFLPMRRPCRPRLGRRESEQLAFFFGKMEAKTRAPHQRQNRRDRPPGEMPQHSTSTCTTAAAAAYLSPPAPSESEVHYDPWVGTDARAGALKTAVDAVRHSDWTEPTNGEGKVGTYCLLNASAPLRWTRSVFLNTAAAASTFRSSCAPSDDLHLNVSAFDACDASAVDAHLTASPSTRLGGAWARCTGRLAAWPSRDSKKHTARPRALAVSRAGCRETTASCASVLVCPANPTAGHRASERHSPTAVRSLKKPQPLAEQGLAEGPETLKSARAAPLCWQASTKKTQG
ncbi:hypothetical protein CSOJ01_04457 [Colletotrichum sojae]|uniref:Uncharacterized protein n=1 Tax=Colletotrichum sojae TaxID=2175907 RepID=A0A8H6JJG6_9PEZI|nr:hypothetical protein CSOJ01_04457 [Colletotrichum sojae]